jgi:hypothetical protein
MDLTEATATLVGRKSEVRCLLNSPCQSYPVVPATERAPIIDVIGTMGKIIRAQEQEQLTVLTNRALELAHLGRKRVAFVAFSRNASRVTPWSRQWLAGKTFQKPPWTRSRHWK